MESIGNERARVGMPTRVVAPRLLRPYGVILLLLGLVGAGCSHGYVRAVGREHRAAAAEATGACTPPAYFYALSSDNPKKRVKALEQCEKHHNIWQMSSCYAPPLIAALQSNDRTVRMEALALLESARGRCQYKDHDPRCYGRLGPAFHAVIERLTERDSTVRKQALEFLKGFPAERIPDLYDDRMQEVLIAVLEDRDADVRRQAYYLLMDTEDEGLVPMYVEHAAGHREDLAKHGARAMWSFDLERRATLMEPHYPALRGALDDPEHPARHHIVKAFGRLDAATAAPLLVPLLGHDAVKVRREAVQALADLDKEVVRPLLGPEAIEDLRGLTSDEWNFVRGDAERLLKLAGALD